MEQQGNVPQSFPQEYNEMSIIHADSLRDDNVKHLIQSLIEWVNDQLAGDRIIVRDLKSDFYDGQVLQKLLEKLLNQKFDVPEVTQSEEKQKEKLKIVIEMTNYVLGSNTDKWSVEEIYCKNALPVLHLLIALAKHFQAPILIPERLTIKVIVAQLKKDGTVSHRTVFEELTGARKDDDQSEQQDAFDILYESSDEIELVKSSLITFVNKHLNKLHFEVRELQTQFHDGVHLILLLGLLEGFYVPLHEYYVIPKDFRQKVHNVSFYFQLAQDIGLPKTKSRPEDIVNKDLKSTLRVLYFLFVRYKHLN